VGNPTRSQGHLAAQFPVQSLLARCLLAAVFSLQITSQVRSSNLVDCSLSRFLAGMCRAKKGKEPVCIKRNKKGITEP
jgi:hypothetical protein